MSKIREMHLQLAQKPSDINEHLETLAKYAGICGGRICEFWVRNAVSTAALLSWLLQNTNENKRLISYDIRRSGEVTILENLAKEDWLDFAFVQGDTTDPARIIEECDMLFIDTLHNARQILLELSIHAINVKQYILFHDTTTFWENGETEKEWLLVGMRKFLSLHKERDVKEVFTNNNWLTVWQRLG